MRCGTEVIKCTCELLFTFQALVFAIKQVKQIGQVEAQEIYEKMF